MKPSASPQSQPDIRDLIAAHDREIRDAVGKKYAISSDELKVLEEQSFPSDSEPGTYCFMLLHASGFYGVTAKVQKGKLVDVKALQM